MSRKRSRFRVISRWNQASVSGSFHVGQDSVLNTVAEGNKVCIEAVGDMKLRDGRNYRNTYHHVVEFEDGLIVSIREYFDTAYVKEMFGQHLYENTDKQG